MADRPILFSAPMILGLLQGRKMQTRRVLTRNNSSFGSAPRSYWDHADFSKAYPENGYLHVPCHASDSRDGIASCPRCDEMGWDGTVHRLWPKWEIDDRLWVREAHYLTDDGDNELAVYAEDEASVRQHLAQISSLEDRHVAANWSRHKKLRPSIHMPRWASRLTLVVENVRVQRLQDISEADAMAEGVEMESADPPFYYVPGIFPHSRTAVGVEEPGHVPHAVRSYAKLWSEINGPGSWESNPWIIALTFHVIKANIDADEARAA